MKNHVPVFKELITENDCRSEERRVGKECLRLDEHGLEEMSSELKES